MGTRTEIAWTDHTFNPWMGCTKVSPGCANCYAETLMDTRMGKVKWGKGKPRQRTSAANWKLPLKWNRDQQEILADVNTQHFIKQGILKVQRPRVFCSSLADWLDDEVPIEWLANLLQLIHATPNLDWQLLTKRPENWRPRFESLRFGNLDKSEWNIWIHDWVVHARPPSNVWIGVSVEDQKRADERIPALLRIPAKVRFLSIEPLLWPVDLPVCRPHIPDTDARAISWAIIGGESGKGARPCNVEWIRSIVGQCRAASVPVFVKQLGAAPWQFNEEAHQLDPLVLLDRKGGDPAEWPVDLRVREFP